MLPSMQRNCTPSSWLLRVWSFSLVLYLGCFEECHTNKQWNCQKIHLPLNILSCLYHVPQILDPRASPTMSSFSNSGLYYTSSFRMSSSRDSLLANISESIANLFQVRVSSLYCSEYCSFIYVLTVLICPILLWDLSF